MKKGFWFRIAEFGCVWGYGYRVNPEPFNPNGTLLL